MFKSIVNPIQGRIDKLKNGTKKFQIVDEFMREYIKRMFPKIASIVGYTVEVKANGDVVIKFKNKIIAQEISFKREEIQSSLYQRGVTGRIIFN